MKPDEPTWDLDRFRAAYEADDNIWWASACGHHMNLFDEACEGIDALQARLAKVEALCDERGVYAFRTGEPYVRVSLVRAALAAPDETPGMKLTRESLAEMQRRIVTPPEDGHR